jgi:hypothetical protein
VRGHDTTVFSTVTANRAKAVGEAVTRLQKASASEETSSAVHHLPGHTADQGHMCNKGTVRQLGSRDHGWSSALADAWRVQTRAVAGVTEKETSSDVLIRAEERGHDGRLGVGEKEASTSWMQYRISQQSCGLMLIFGNASVALYESHWRDRPVEQVQQVAVEHIIYLFIHVHKTAESWAA